MKKIYLLLLTLASLSRSYAAGLAPMEDEDDSAAVEKTQGVKRKAPHDGFDDDDQTDRSVKAKTVHLTQEELNKQLLEASLSGNVQQVEELINLGANIEALNEDLNTPLHIASRAGHYEVVRFLITKGANIKALTCMQNTPLHLASHPEIVDLLVENLANIEALNIYGDTPLLQSLGKSVDIFKNLVAYGANILVKDREDNSVLHLAVINGNRTIIEEILKAGFPIDIEGQNGYTSLIAACYGGDLNIIEYLLDNKANINAQCPYGTSLHLAAEKGNYSIAKLLLERNADLNAKNTNNNTALHIAAITNNNHIIKLLFDHRADIESRGYNENTALITACIADNLNCIENLLDNKANVNAQNVNGWSPLHLAAEKDKYPMAKLLLARNANVHAKNKDNNTPLHIAALGGNNHLIKLLFDHKVDIEARGYNENTPLMSAIWENKLDAVQLLHTLGASLDSRDNYNRAAVHIAAVEGHIGIIEYLLATGIDINLKANNNLTPLFYAIRNNQFIAAKFLISMSADVESSDNIGRTIFFNAIIKHKIDAAKFLIDCKANVHAMDNFKQTAIAILERDPNSSLTSISLLLKNGAEIGLSQHYLAGYFEPFGINSWTSIPSKLYGPDFAMAHKQRYELLKPILDNRPHFIKEALAKNIFSIDLINKQDLLGMTALMWAACRGCYEIVESLLDHNSNGQTVNMLCEDIEGETALSLAKKHNKRAIARLLYDRLSRFRNPIMRAINDSHGARLMDNDCKNLIFEYIFG